MPEDALNKGFSSLFQNKNMPDLASVKDALNQTAEAYQYDDMNRPTTRTATSPTTPTVAAKPPA